MLQPTTSRSYWNALPPRGRGAVRLDTAGLTLVEVVVAMGILAFAITAMLQVSVSHLLNGSINRHRTEAVLDAQLVLDDIRALRDTGVSVPVGLVEAFPAGALALDAATLPEEQVTIAYADPGAAPLEVTVTVEWVEMNGRPMNEMLTTMIDRN